MVLSLILVILIFWYFTKPVVWNHEITPVGGQITGIKKLEKDLKFIYYNKYSIESVDTFKIKNISLIGKENEILRDYLNSKDNKLLQISMTDSKDVYGEIREKEIVTREAVNILYYISERKFDSSIKAINVFYRPKRFLAMTGQVNIIIPVEDYLNEIDKYKSKGLSADEIVLRLSLHFLKNTD